MDAEFEPWPLMSNNITREDADALKKFLGDSGEPPILTNSTQCREFEREWSEWLGVKYSVFVNSGSSANQLTMAALKFSRGGGEIITPTLTWVSDVAAVLQNGFDPVFVDIDPKTLGMDPKEVLKKITPKTKAVFLTHILGYNALTRELIDELEKRKIPLIEDCCESHGATFEGRKIGTFSLMSNFSFYYAHHLSTIEGGMVCTNSREDYELIRMLRSHGMVREVTDEGIKNDYKTKYPDLNPDFIFAYPAYNFRSTELNAILGRSQLKRLDDNNIVRAKKLKVFLDNLDSKKYFTEFATDGNSNYAFTLILRKPNEVLRDNVEKRLREHKIEFRRGTSGGGNQTRQPYLKDRKIDPRAFPHVDHVHFFGYYIGNYPTLAPERVRYLCKLLNNLPDDKRI